MRKKITKLLIGAFAFTMAVFQPASAFPDGSALNTVVTAEAATASPGKVKLKSIRAVTNNKIQINWNKTSGATHYRIYYKKYGARKWTFLRAVNANVTSYTHTSSAKYPIKCGQKYTYTVRAYNSRTKKWGSYDTGGLTARTVPTTVSLKGIKTNSDKTNVQVSWNKAYGGNYYRVYRKTPESGWNLIATVKSNIFSYTDKNPVKGQKNIYTVRMYNSAMKAAGGYNTTGVSVTVPVKVVETPPKVTPTPTPEATPSPSPTPTPENSEISLDEMEKEVVRLTNEARIEKGIAPLQYSQKLSDLAFLRAKQRSKPWDGEPFPGLVEFWCESTSALGSTYKTVEVVVKDWLYVGSGHVQITDPSNTYTGVGLYKDNNERIYWIQLFSDFDPEQACTVTLDAYGGILYLNGIDYFIVPHGKMIYPEDLPVPRHPDYAFAGWTYKNSYFTQLPVYGDITLEATWGPK